MTYRSSGRGHELQIADAPSDLTGHAHHVGQLCVVLNPPQLRVYGAGEGGWASVGQHRDITFVAANTATTWTAMPSAVTEFRGLTNYRIRADLSGALEMRLCVRVLVAGAVGSNLRPQFSLDGGATFTNLSASEFDWNPPGRALIDTAGQDVQHSGWRTIATSAQTDVLLRLVGQGGDGVASPEFGVITLGLR